MATQVLELAGDGFDLDDAVAADLDASPGAAAPTAAPPTAGPTAAAHTYDKGYKKWGPNWKKIADMVKTRNNKQVCSRSLVVLVQVVQVPPVPKVQ